VASLKKGLDSKYTHTQDKVYLSGMLAALIGVRVFVDGLKSGDVVTLTSPMAAPPGRIKTVLYLWDTPISEDGCGVLRYTQAQLKTWMAMREGLPPGTRDEFFEASLEDVKKNRPETLFYWIQS
jgi:hypothetical protein